MTTRLDKFICNTTPYSRKDCQRLVRAGEVKINGETAKQTSTKINDNDQIEISGEVISALQPGYWMLNKPEGYICANTDESHPTVIDIFSMSELPYRQIDRLQIAGRLDLDTTGLVLLTTEGQWNHKVTSPNQHCVKRYRVNLAEALSTEDIEEIETGVQLHGEKHLTRPAKLTQVNETECLLEISEGKYHQVKRMFAAVSNRVVRLHREAIGKIELDPILEAGEFRELTEKEITSV